MKIQKTIANENRRGQALIEFVASMTLLIPVSAGILVLTLSTLSAFWLKAECFALAREALYAQSSRCRGSQAGENLGAWASFVYRCSADGLVRGEFRLREATPISEHLNLIEKLEGL